MSLRFFPPDPGYGDGVYRRRVRMVRVREGVFAAALDDDFHAMWARIEHDGVRVTRVGAGMTRVPTTMCAGAAAPLGELAGMPLATDYATLFGEGRPRRNCTHLFDLGWLLLAHACRDAASCTYDVTVPDAPNGAGVAEVALDGRPVHRWRFEGERLTAPAELVGIPMIGGFSRVLVGRYAGEALDAALVLHRGWFVSRARRHRVEPDRRVPMVEGVGQLGACHAYSPPQVEAGWIVPGNQRDFTHGLIEAPFPEQALA